MVGRRVFQFVSKTKEKNRAKIEARRNRPRPDLTNMCAQCTAQANTVENGVKLCSTHSEAGKKAHAERYARAELRYEEQMRCISAVLKASGGFHKR